MRIAARSPAAIAAIRASSDMAHTNPPLLADLGTGEPVVCIVIGLPRAAASHLGRKFSRWLFHLVYIGRSKWFRGVGVLFRAPCSNETIGRFAMNALSPRRHAQPLTASGARNEPTGPAGACHRAGQRPGPVGRPDDRLRE